MILVHPQHNLPSSSFLPSHLPLPLLLRLSPDTPSQRVQFILGTEEDAEHVTHELFTELDEICVKEGKDAEWKETARSDTAGSPSWSLTHPAPCREG